MIRNDVTYQMVTRWTATGAINSGDWVMLGGPTLLNKIKTTAWWVWKSGVEPVTMEVPKSALAFPVEQGIIGGPKRLIQGPLFGQRIIR